MKRIRYYLLGLAVLMASASLMAQGTGANVIESMQVVQQDGVLNLRLTFKEPLRTLPQGFSVASPARIALDFPSTTNGTGKSTQTFNEGDLKSVNIVQSDDRIRLVLNLIRMMSYESTIEGRSLRLALTPSAGKAWQDGGVDRVVEHFSKSQTVTGNNIRDIAFHRAKDGGGRITVDLSDSNSGIDIRQQGQSLLVDFINVNAPEGLRKKLLRLEWEQ